jgi:uncharacterized metal-binding protein YceD (DUF177 family)
MTAVPELSRRVLAEHIGRADTEITVDATPDERRAVAQRLMIPSIASLRCKWTLRPGEAGMIQGHGELQAKLKQECVITLDPFDVVVREAFEVHFVLEGRESEDDDPDAPDELIYDGVAVDIGEATVEQLALILDPYPRKPDAVLLVPGAEEEGGAFAALAKLRRLD